MCAIKENLELISACRGYTWIPIGTAGMEGGQGNLESGESREREKGERQTEELYARECKRETTIDAQSEQSATTRWAMSSGRRSDDNILAFARTSLGRRQTTPASFCSADNSSIPSGSLQKSSNHQLQAAARVVASSPEQRPCRAQLGRGCRPQRSRDAIDHRPLFQHQLLFLWPYID